MEHKAARLEDIPVDGMLAVEVGDVALVLFRQVDGTVLAFRDRCTHADVAISGGECAAGKVTCPAHGAEFDTRTGKALCMPAVKPLKSFNVRVLDGEVHVEL